MRHVDEITERTQAVLIRSRAFRERAQARREEYKALIERASIKTGQLHFVFPTSTSDNARH